MVAADGRPTLRAPFRAAFFNGSAMGVAGVSGRRRGTAAFNGPPRARSVDRGSRVGLRVQTVSEPAHRHQMAGQVRVFLDLLSQEPDVAAEGAPPFLAQTAPDLADQVTL